MLALAILDATLLWGGYNLLFWHRFGHWPGLTGSIGALLVLWLGTSYLLGRYSTQNYGRRLPIYNRLLTTLMVAALVGGITITTIWGLRITDPRGFRSFVVPLLVATTLGSAIGQLSVAVREERPRRWLMLGPEHELEVLKNELDREAGRDSLELKFCCNTEEAIQICNSQALFDGYAVSDSIQLEDSLLQTLLQRRNSGQTIGSLVDWCEQHLQRVPPELLSARWFLLAEGFRLRPGRWGWRLKRLGDLTLSALLLATSSPLLLLAALLIYLEDGGPVLYSQIRTGLYGDAFRIWKLRTMHPEAELKGAQWSQRNDPRITRVGTWLRRLRIDELPQLLGVISGDMSLIGPRPERPELDHNLEQRIPHYRVRHWIRPGLSGWAQVCFPYGASIHGSRMKLSYDIYYLRHFSIGLDFLILLKTIRLISHGKGALADSQ
jgi:exopolysaccharide biosynthesis polyprenyl glycosylphosphotransferase